MSTQSPPAIIRRDVGEVAVLRFDTPGRSMNVVDEDALGHLRELVEGAQADPGVRSIVFVSGKPGSFGAGADVDWLPRLAARPDAEEFLASVHELMYRIAEHPKPFVTGIDGVAMGGAFELALAGDAIVATARARVGLPEITLGVIPGGAGTQLIRRWVPIGVALDILLEGRVLDGETAREAGIVQEVVAAGDLERSAIALATRLADEARGARGTVDDGADVSAALEERAAKARSEAAMALIDVVRAGQDDGSEAGCAQERRAFLSLIPSREARARIHLFTAESEIKRRSRNTASPVAVLGVVGGGQMGAGIGATALSRGIAPIVRDIDAARLDAAQGYARRVLTRSAAEDQVDAELARWRGTTGWEGFEDADAVIEAVFELPELKRETLAAVESRVPEDALVTTNTSAIPIASLAEALSDASRFLGTHFFSPVDRMPLVELIPHAGTSPEAVERASALGTQLGKVPVVVADRPGFFTSRVYARWLIEGVRLLIEGVPAAQIEAQARAAGYPVGPLQACDEATLDLVVKASIVQVAEPTMADRLEVASVRTALEALITAGIEGRRQGTGFYRYRDGRRDGLNPAVADVLGAAPTELPDEEVADRLLLAFATECFLCWDDGTLCHPDDGDVASVLGIGFPRALGGPFHWADAEGLTKISTRSRRLGATAFPVGITVPRLIDSGGAFAEEVRRSVPRVSA